MQRKMINFQEARLRQGSQLTLTSSSLPPLKSFKKDN